jgi:L-asparagine transporter-like permease
MATAILLAIYAPGRAFLMLYGVAIAGMFFVWAVILLSHIRFRNSLNSETGMRLAFSPYSNWLGIASLLGITATTFYVDGLQYSVPAFVLFLSAVSLVYWRSSRKNQNGQDLSCQCDFSGSIDHLRR